MRPGIFGGGLSGAGAGGDADGDGSGDCRLTNHRACNGDCGADGDCRALAYCRAADGSADGDGGSLVNAHRPGRVTGQAYDMPAGSFPHDVAPAPDGTVWVTLMFKGEMARLDPATGEIRRIWLSGSAAPHGVIIGPDGAAWVTDQGSNAIIRIDNETEEIERFPLPSGTPNAHLNTATFDNNGILWFTGEAGYYGRLDPATGEMQVWEAPRGQGPYGITTTPSGEVFYASLAGSHIAQINTATGEATVIEPPTPGQGARRIWSDSQGRVWVSEWNAGQVAVYYPATGEWREWRLPGNRPSAYAVYVDEQDIVWLTDFGGDAIVRFDPATEQFRSYRYTLDGDVRQLLGRPGEVWGAESATDKVIVIRTGEAEATDG